MNKLLIILQITIIIAILCIGNTASTLNADQNKIGFEITKKWTEWTVEIKDKNSILKKSFKGLSKDNGSDINLYWDGKDEGGKHVEDGTYDYKVKLYWDAAAPETKLIAIGDVMESEGELFSAPGTEYILNSKDYGRPKSGVKAIYYKINDKGWIEYSNPIKFDKEGMYTISYRAEDMAGNMGKENNVSVIVDETPPEIIIKGIGDKEYYNHEVTIEVEIIDDSPLAMSSIVLDNGIFISGGIVTEEGSHDFVVEARDAGNNLANRAVLFTIDMESPVVNISGVNDIDSVACPVINVSDDNLLKIEVFLNGELSHNVDNLEDNSYKYEMKEIIEEKDYTLIVKAADKAHNITEEIVKFSIKKDGWQAFYASYDESGDADDSAGYGKVLNEEEIELSAEGLSNSKALSAECIGAMYMAKDNIDESRGTVIMRVKPYWEKLSGQEQYFFCLKDGCQKDDSSEDGINNSNNGFNINFVFFNSRGLFVQIEDAGGNIIEQGLEESDEWYKSDEWTHLAFSWDSVHGDIRIYINGVQKGAREGMNGWMPKDKSNFWVGNRHNDSSRKSESNIDSFRIYKKMLTGDEIKEILYQEQ